MLKFFGIGHLTADPETRVTPKGASITNARIAVNRDYKDGENKTVEIVDFWELKILGPRGEAFAKHLGKGSKVCVEGELQQDHWTDKETQQKRTKPVLLVNNWEFADSKRLGAASNAETGAAVGAGVE
jgi:single-strand DNA-binding protein